MIKHVMMLMLCVIMLSACDSNSSGVTINNAASGERYVPIDLTKVTESTTGMVISGAVEHNSGEVQGYWIRVDRGFAAYRNIEVEGQNGYLLRITHDVSLPDGTYPITKILGTDELGGTDVAGGLLYLWSPDESKQFTQNPQGTLTIQRIDDMALGTFSLTVENINGEQVHIDGRFQAQETASAVR